MKGIGKKKRGQGSGHGRWEDGMGWNGVHNLVAKGSGQTTRLALDSSPQSQNLRVMDKTKNRSVCLIHLGVFSVVALLLACSMCIMYRRENKCKKSGSNPTDIRNARTVDTLWLSP